MYSSAWVVSEHIIHRTIEVFQYDIGWMCVHPNEISVQTICRTYNLQSEHTLEKLQESVKFKIQVGKIKESMWLSRLQPCDAENPKNSFWNEAFGKGIPRKKVSRERKAVSEAQGINF